MVRYLLLLFFVVPVQAQTTVQLDTTLQDKDCGDFRSMIQAQGYYLALQVMTGEEDPDRLDADGNGVACEGKTFSSIRDLGNENVIWYEERPIYVQCSTTEGWFALDDFYDQARVATTDSVGYMQEGGLLYRAECLHTISQIVK